MHGNPDQTIHQLLLGIMLAYMVWETRNIWVSILVHFFNNFLAITITYLSSAIASSNTLAESATEEAATAVTWTDIAYTYVLGAAIAALAIYFIIKIVARIKTQSEKVNGSPVTENLQLAVTIDGAATISNDGAMVSIGGGESENLPARDAAKDDNADEQIKVTKGAKLISAMCYALFAAYFLWEWISTFISRL
jgi:large-conductance mechanosensitive channel